MKDNPVGVIVLGSLALALVVGLGVAIWLIGEETLQKLAWVLVVAIALALVLGVSALPIRAWRRKDAEPVQIEHHYHDGTTKVIERHTIDGRPVAAAPEVKLLQLPAQQNGGGAFPEMLRAAYRAGMLTEGPAQFGPVQDVGATWDGEIEG